MQHTECKIHNGWAAPQLPWLEPPRQREIQWVTLKIAIYLQHDSLMMHVHYTPWTDYRFLLDDLHISGQIDS